MSSGNQHRRSANRNWDTNSPPYGYGGGTGDTMGFAVRIIISPAFSSRFFVGRNARSATLRTTQPLLRDNPCARRPGRAANFMPQIPALPTGNRCAQMKQRVAKRPCGTFRRAVRGSRWMLAVPVATLVAVSGCGGGERQDANEKSGTYTVAVDAKFPDKQHISQPERFELAVHNTASRAVPNVAVTVQGFSAREENVTLADPDRPVWVVDRDPVGGATAYTNTWALGPLRAGETKHFVWRVTPLRSGSHTVKYRVAAGLNGKAKAQLSGGSVPEGSVDVAISRKPVQATVDPETGKVVREGEGQ